MAKSIKSALFSNILHGKSDKIHVGYNALKILQRLDF